MSMQKVLDKAIKASETKSHRWYRTKTGRYTEYMTKREWNHFLDDMITNHTEAYCAFKNGGGKELEERTSGKYVYPPKMASYGSSSRMIYILAKDICDFKFEKQLPTYVGGTANLDGFIEKDNCFIFVEAKCHEPYHTKKERIQEPYKELYKYISESDKTPMICSTDTLVFSYNENEINFFDMKQMICHMLGIAGAVIDGKYREKDIRFLYLLFNPTKINIPDTNEKEKILDVYKRICNECNMIDFSVLFEVIFNYQKERLKKGKQIDDFAYTRKFIFRLCDADEFIKEIS